MYPTQPAPTAPATSPFAPAAPAPAAGDRIQAKQCIGHLLILVPVAHKSNFFPPQKKQDGTMGGPGDAVQLDLVDLDVIDPGTGQRGRAFHDVMWGAARVLGSLTESLRTNPPGTPVLARMVEGNATGAGVPLELADASADPGAVQVAMAFMAARPNWRNERSQAAPAPAPVQQQYAPAPQALPYPTQQYAPGPVPQPQQYAPAPAAAPMPAPGPIATAPAQVAQAYQAGMQQIDPAVWAQLAPEAQQQLLAMGAQPVSS